MFYHTLKITSRFFEKIVSDPIGYLAYVLQIYRLQYVHVQYIVRKNVVYICVAVHNFACNKIDQKV